MFKVDVEGFNRNCNTCHFNFGEGVGCAAAHYGVDVTEIMKDSANFPCGDYKISFDLYMELAAEGKIKL